MKGTQNHGRFEGSAIISYSDKTEMVVKFKYGVVQGKIHLYDKFKRLTAIGVYFNGLPHGPFWIINDWQFCQVHFWNGSIGK